jgi:hypothetical protein
MFRRLFRWLLAGVAGLVLSGCLLFTIDQRTTHGPTAEEVWTYRFAAENRRTPNFEEKLAFKEQLDRRMREYLVRNPRAEGSDRRADLAFWFQVSVGMTKEEVGLLLGKADAMTTDPTAMEALARKFWPDLKPKSQEAWTYPEGWTLYFADNLLIALTQYLRKIP